MNLGWFMVRALIATGILAVLFLSQRFWYRALWRVTSNWGRVWLRMSLRILYLAGLAALYVNRGIGTVGAPVRLGAPPEITHIVLRSA